MISRLTGFLLWICVGYIVLRFADHLGPIPYSFREMIYYKIESIRFFKLTHIFLEMYLYRFVLAFVSTMILCIVTTYSIPRIIIFIVCYNYSALLSVYSILFTDKWDHLKTGSIELFLAESVPVFFILSVSISLLGCYVGTKLKELHRGTGQEDAGKGPLSL